VEVENLERVADDSTKVLLLSYPNNPTGATMLPTGMESVGEYARERNLIVISDEIYADLTYDGPHVSAAAVADGKGRTILVGGFSKSWAMTGWRLGFAAGPAEIISAMTKVHSYTVMCPPTVAQEAALEALRACDEDVLRMRREYNRRRRVIYKRLNAMGLECFEPRGAFYAFPSIACTGMASDEFAERLLEEEKVAVVPGTAFGSAGEGFVRCSYATSMPLLEEALGRMAAFAERAANRA
jgi:aminotransferase